MQVCIRCSAERHKVTRGLHCRSYVRFHNTADNFRLHACASCFNFLFYFLNPRLNTSNDDPQLAFIYNGNLINLKSWDFRNHSVQNSVCSYLSNDECQRWLSCCQSADSCCERQLSLPAEVNNTCGRIWDGWLCWNDAASGSHNYNSCPLFVPFFTQSRKYYNTVTAICIMNKCKIYWERSWPQGLYQALEHYGCNQLCWTNACLGIRSLIVMLENLLQKTYIGTWTWLLKTPIEKKYI